MVVPRTLMVEPVATSTQTSQRSLLAPSAGAVGESGGGHAHQVLRRLTAGEASRQAEVDAALVARAEKRVSEGK